MSPSEVKRYLRHRGIAPMADLVHRFDCDAEAMHGVLEFWARKGKVRRLPGRGESCGGGCLGCGERPCATSLGDLYQWLEDDAPAAADPRHVVIRPRV